MVKERNIAVCIILSIVTCGIYGLYWFVCLADDANSASGEDGTTGLLALLLTIVTCNIYGLYWAYRQGEKLDGAKASRNIPTSNSGILYLLLTLLGFSIIAWALMQNELNSIANDTQAF